MADDLVEKLGACDICKARFHSTKTQHRPRPVVWFSAKSSILIAGQAPGLRVHESGIPFDDRSGDRLRHWLGVDRSAFYDRDLFSVVPMAFCFPGYNASGHDLPPPKICASTWREDVMASLPNIKLTVLIGKYAMDWHLGGNKPVKERVANWKLHQPSTFVLPHPSWRNTGWLKANPFFESEVIPVLRSAVQEVMV